MNSWILAAPVLLPFATTVAVLLAGKSRMGPKWVSLAGSLLHFGATIVLGLAVAHDGILATGMGGWDAPVGIVLVADAFSAIMAVAIAGMGAVIAIYALADIDPRRSRAGWHAFYQVLLGGASGAVLTGDLFNLYVWFEVLLIGSFGLLVLGNTRPQLSGAITYVALNLIATLMFLIAVGLIHGPCGDAHAGRAAGPTRGRAGRTYGGRCALAVRCLRGQGGALPALSLAACGLSHAAGRGDGDLCRDPDQGRRLCNHPLFTLVFPDGPVHDLMLPIAVLTMVVGVIGAAAQTEVHRILSFHIVSQIGYIVLGLAIGGTIAMMAAVLYLVHNIVVKANLFLIAGVGRRLTGSHVLARTGGLYAGAAGLSILFFISAAAMAGLPPFSGFWGKLAFVQSGSTAEMWTAVAATLGSVSSPSTR